MYISLMHISLNAYPAIKLYFWTHTFSSPRWRNLLAWIVGCTFFANTPSRKLFHIRFSFTDANTIGSISGIASIDWGCAVQIMAAASIGSGQTYSATRAQTL